MRLFLRIIGSLTCAMAGIALAVQLQPPLGQPPAFPNVAPSPQLVNPDAVTSSPGELPANQPSPALESIQPLPLPPGVIEPEPVADNEILRRIKERQAADPLTRKPEAGDDELKRLLKERYNAALFAYKYTEAAYSNGTVTFDELTACCAKMLHAYLELSDKPADQIDAIERYLVFAKQTELKVFSLYKSQTKGGEADKYEKAKYMRLDAEIQLLRAKRKAAAIER